MTKEEMFKEMEKMAPVLGRNGVDIVLGRRIPGSFTRGYFFNEEAGLWEVYSCGERNEYFVRKQTVPFPVSWTVKMKKKQKETQDILSYHTQAAGCSDKARAKASGGRQPIEECGRTGL